MNQVPKSNKTFDELGIAPKLLEILTRNKFFHPTPIQEQSIPPAITGKDLMGIAQTGTGKTLAFGIPMIQRILQTQGKTMGLVILPTRELALQVDQTLKKIGESIGLKTAILIGGENPAKQHKALSLRPQIIIATPGRIIDHIENSNLSLSKVGILVLDEADRMLDMGFAPQIKKVLQSVPKQRQTMIFSATMPQAIIGIAKSYMSLPLRVEVAPSGTTVKSVTQELFFVDNKDKVSLLQNILTQYSGSILVFTRTKFGAKKINHKIKAMGHTSNEIHSNRTLSQRLEALQGFKIGRYRILVATDIAARGIDVSGIQLVINYDLPDNPEDYIHRIGRTARAGRTGHAISFATPDQRGDIKNIERLIKITLPVTPTPNLPRTEQPKMQSDYNPTPNKTSRQNLANYRLDRFKQQDRQNKNNPYNRRRNKPRPSKSSGKRRWSAR
jgi:ATP-dependent RNA helicase RhlE